MISKKRYLELKKRRKVLHKVLVKAKLDYRKVKKERDSNEYVYFLSERYHMARRIYRDALKEYNLITELIDSTKRIMRVDMAFRMAKVMNKSLYKE